MGNNIRVAIDFMYFVLRLKQLVVTAGLGAGYQQDMDPRFLRHANIIYMAEKSRQELEAINTSIMEWHFADKFSNTISRMASVSEDSWTISCVLIFNHFICLWFKVISCATIELYEHWRQQTVNQFPICAMGVSSIARVVQGLMAVKKSSLVDVSQLHRLWIHEVCRVWVDAFQSEQDRRAFFTEMNRISNSHFKISVEKYVLSESLGKPDYSHLPKIYFSQLETSKTRSGVFGEVNFVFSVRLPCRRC